MGERIVLSRHAYKFASLNSDYGTLKYVKNKPSKTVIHRKNIKKNKKPKNFFASLTRFFFFLLLAFFVVPFCFDKITKPLFFISKSNSYIKIDYFNFLNRTRSYISNSYFNGYRLLSAANHKKPQMQPLILANEMTQLKNQLEEIVRSYPQLKPSIFVFDFQTNNFVDINANVQRPTASIIKLPILVELFKSIELNQVKLSDKLFLTEYLRTEGSGSLQYQKAGNFYDLDYLARIMITDSDNSATNMIMEKLGGKVAINRAIRSWGLSKTYVGNWLPDLEGKNISTAFELGTLLFNIDNSTFLSLNSREKMIDYMSHVKNNRLIATSLSEGSLIAHKTGDIGKMLGDSGIVYLPNGKRYILVCLVERPHNNFAAKEFIVKASKIVYNYMERSNY